jgi:succinate-semialdehyde dehydrogenase/glutarate-semialdehyde dehydrogenase
MVNDAISCFGISEAPHGGVKASGIGRTHGRFGLEEMVWIKYLDTDLLPRMKKPWWYGYSVGLSEAAGGLLDFQFAQRLGNRLKGGIRSLPLIRRPRL